MPNTENSYFPMSSIIYLIPKKKKPNTEFCELLRKYFKVKMISFSYA